MYLGVYIKKIEFWYLKDKNLLKIYLLYLNIRFLFIVGLLDINFDFYNKFIVFIYGSFGFVVV